MNKYLNEGCKPVPFSQSFSNNHRFSKFIALTIKLIIWGLRKYQLFENRIKNKLIGAI